MSMIAATWLALALVQAPTAAELGCVLATASESDRAGIDAGVRRGQIDEAIVERVATQAHVCAERFGWDEPRGGAMTAAAMVTVARQALAADLAGRGIDPGIVDRWFAGQSEEMRTTYEIDDARGAAIVRGLALQGIPGDRLDSHGEMVGQYLGTLIVLERVRLRLPFD
jgi:hypothetical protein